MDRDRRNRFTEYRNVSAFRAIARARLPIYPIVKTLDSRTEFTHGLATVSQPMVQKMQLLGIGHPVTVRLVNDGGTLTVDD